MLNAAQEILKEFVNHSSQIFGKFFVVYNIHCLIHLVDECRNHGTLESFNAFKYESFMGIMKRYLKFTYKPLHQLIRRDTETKGQFITKKDINEPNKILLKNQYNKDDTIQGEQFQTIVLRNLLLLRTKQIVVLRQKNGDVVILDNVIRTLQNQIFLIGYKFLKQENYYDFLIASSELGIIKVSRLQNHRTVYKIKHFFCKCVL